MPPILIVAYGNPLRSDDGVAFHLADALESNFAPSEVEILRLHQLAPEVAETVSRFACVIFVDAAEPSPVAGSDSRAPGEIRVETLTAESEPASNARFSHAVSPTSVLRLASRLFGSSPSAFVVTMTAESFGPGESLSPAVASALPALVRRIQELVQAFLHQPRDS